MTRLILWLLLTLMGLVLAFFGLCEPETFIHGTFFSGVALAIHSLFGEDA